MCATCGCGSHLHEHDHDHHHHEHGSSRTLSIEADLLEKNDRIAADNRAWLQHRGIAAVNLMSAPGAGKTALLERTVRALALECSVAVIEGDQETERDAARIRSTGCPVVQINTGAGCHLDAEMLRRGLRELAPPSGSLLFVENVGNLVCPALFDLGERAKVVLMSVTEGEDKPLKYPHMFRAAELLLLTKVDLLPHLDFDVDQMLGHVRAVNPRIHVFMTSAKRKDGLDAWFGWLRGQLSRQEARA